MQLLQMFPKSWKTHVHSQELERILRPISTFLETEIKNGKTIYPAAADIFKAFEKTKFENVKVVILGQDPYHGSGQAMGFSFAVPNSHFPKPPSLKNILKEISNEFQIALPHGNSDLSAWARQGVLLMNTLLTVEEGKPLSHKDRGWLEFSKLILSSLNNRDDGIVFLLWGATAQSVKPWIHTSKHVVLETTHPSPLSAHRGFLGSGIFKSANEALQRLGKEPIHWTQISDISGDF